MYEDEMDTILQFPDNAGNKYTTHELSMHMVASIQIIFYFLFLISLKYLQ